MSEEVGSPNNPDKPEGIRETTYKQRATREEAPATEAVRTALSDVQAETVMMDRSNSPTISAERVVMERSAAKTIETRSAQLDRSAVVALGTENAVLLRSRAIQVVSEEARLNRSRAVFMSAGNAEIENSRIILFAGNAQGELKPVFTPMTAAVAGAGLGLVLLVLGALGRSIFGRD